MSLIRFASTYASTFADPDAPRGDLYVFDVEAIDRDKAVALIAYDGDQNPPSLSDIHRFAKKTFAGKVVVQTSTAKVHKFDNAVSVTLTANTMQRPAEDRKTMRSITATQYAEKGTGFVWSLVTSANGDQYLARSLEENVADIIARAQKRNASRPNLTAASLHTAGLYIDEGDSVKFFGPSNAVLFGAVSSIKGDQVTIKTPHNGESYTVSNLAVIETVEKGEAAKAREKAKELDFFALAYGDREFAEKFVRDSVNDGQISNQIPTFGKSAKTR